MSKEVEINKLIAEKDEPSLEIAHSTLGKDKHLEGFSEDQKKIIRLMANIFVKSVLSSSEK